MSLVQTLSSLEVLNEEKSIISVSIKEIIPTGKYMNIELFASSLKVTDTKNISQDIELALEEIDKGYDSKRQEIIDAIGDEK